MQFQNDWIFSPQKNSKIIRRCVVWWLHAWVFIYQGDNNNNKWAIKIPHKRLRKRNPMALCFPLYFEDERGKKNVKKASSWFTGKKSLRPNAHGFTSATHLNQEKQKLSCGVVWILIILDSDFVLFTMPLSSFWATKGAAQARQQKETDLISRSIRIDKFLAFVTFVFASWLQLRRWRCNNKRHATRRPPRLFFVQCLVTICIAHCPCHRWRVVPFTWFGHNETQKRNGMLRDSRRWITYNSTIE